MTEAPLQLTQALAGRYRVEPEIGRGGMATVYPAYDLKHERKVALKVLHPNFASSPLFAERFLAEIKTTARLQHPHILPLYDSGEAAGQLFYVMPFVEGITLRERIEKERQLKIDEATRFALEIADALAYAHGQGIVHRDIKPENIMLSGQHALVVDFGIARAVMAGADRLTQIGTAIGTPAYMSPEQAFAQDDIDGRSDIYSLGCVLYEMLAGEPPFMGDTPRETMAKRMMVTAPSVAAKRSSVPYRIDAVIRTAMARDPEDRFQTAARFADALGGARIGPFNGDEQRKSIAVLPFVNMSTDPDTEFFSDGISEEILNALVRLPGLRVIARTSSFAFKGKNTDVRAIGEQLGAAMVLEGSVRKSGNRLRITAQLIDAGGGHHLWSERYDREMKDVFDVQDEITAAIRDALSETLLGIGPVATQEKPAIDPATYELFLRGRFFMAKRPEGMQKGMELLGEVLQRAPTYAPAYAELANAYMVLNLFGGIPPRIAGPKVRELANAALAIDPRLARAHAELGNVLFWYERDWPQARKEFEKAVALDPHDPWANALLSHYLSSIGRHDEAIAQCERAKSLDPLNPAVSVSLSIAHFLAGSYEEGVAVCDRTLEQDPTFSEAYRMKGACLRELGRFDEALGPTEAAALYSGAHPWAVALGGMLHAAAGRLEEARTVAQQMISRYKTSMKPPFVAPLAIALIFAMMNDRDSCFEWMEKALEARDGWLVMTRADPSFDRVREDPRYADIIARIGIPEWTAVPEKTLDLKVTEIHA